MDKFEKKQLLGRGGFGSVFFGIEKLTDRKVVLKQVASHLVEKKEVVLLGQLQHPSIIRHFGSYWADDYLTIVMEFAPGGTLASLVEQTSPNHFPLSELLFIISQIANAINFIHSKGIIHRDISARNILIMGNGIIKVADFSISRYHYESSRGEMSGTLMYLSPEQCHQKRASTASDVWAIGCLLYLMASFLHPFSKNTLVATVLSILHDSPPSLPSIYPCELNKLTMKLLSKQPSTRPSADEFLSNPLVLPTYIMLKVTLPSRYMGLSFDTHNK